MFGLRKKKKEVGLDFCGEEFTSLMDENKFIKDNLQLTKVKLIALNTQFEKLRDKINFVTEDPDLDHKELAEQKGVMINNINLQITQNKLDIVKVDTILKDFID